MKEDDGVVVVVVSLSAVVVSVVFIAVIVVVFVLVFVSISLIKVSDRLWPTLAIAEGDDRKLVLLCMEGEKGKRSTRKLQRDEV